MNKLSVVEQAAIVRSLCEGVSIRSTSRMTGASKTTILKLLAEVGDFCSIYQHHALVNLPCVRVEADEIWAYVGAKQANVTKDGQGDIWTYTAICADSKLAVSWFVGPRNHDSTQAFMNDVAARLANRVQLSTDGLRWYVAAVENAFGWNGVDFGQITKVFGNEALDVRGRGRYSPASVVIGVEKNAVMGFPDPAKISTSYVERTNPSMRMQMRRFTRLTNAFSKKAANHAHAVSLNFMYHNFCRAHGTLTKARGGIKTTPAIACGLTDHAWTAEEILEKMDPKNSLLMKLDHYLS